MIKTREGRRYLKSWLAIRLAAGILGLLMPLLLIAGDKLVLDGDPSIRGSLSAYYHSGMRDIFVAILCSVGVFLITYKISDRTLDNALTIAAGVAAIVVALFPTGRDSESQALTPWQQEIGESLCAFVHFTAAGTFTLALALVSMRFAARDAEWGDLRLPIEDMAGQPRSAGEPHTAAALHLLCGVFMMSFVVVFAVLKLVGIHELLFGWSSLLWLELLCTLLFAVSWFVKGWQLRQDLASVERTAGPPAR